MLTLLLASFSFYSDLAWPFAIAVAVILLAGLTLLPALLSIRLSLLAVKRSLFRAMFGRPKLIPWSIQGSGKPGRLGPGRRRGSSSTPAPTLLAGVVFFGGLSFAVLGYTAAGFGGNTSAAGGQRLGGGHHAACQALPAVVGQSDELSSSSSRKPVWDNAAPLAKATSELPAPARLFTQVTGPLNPVGGITLTPAQYQGLFGALGPAQAAAGYAVGGRAAGRQDPGTGLPAVPGDRELRQPRRPDRAVLDRPEGR